MPGRSSTKQRCVSVCVAVPDRGVYRCVANQTEACIRGWASTIQMCTSMGVAVPNRGMHPWVWQYQSVPYMLGVAVRDGQLR
jgi:hypothetical protein